MDCFGQEYFVGQAYSEAEDQEGTAPTHSEHSYPVTTDRDPSTADGTYSEPVPCTKAPYQPHYDPASETALTTPLYTSDTLPLRRPKTRWEKECTRVFRNLDQTWQHSIREHKLSLMAHRFIRWLANHALYLLLFQTDIYIHLVTMPDLHSPKSLVRRPHYDPYDSKWAYYLTNNTAHLDQLKAAIYGQPTTPPVQDLVIPPVPLDITLAVWKQHPWDGPGVMNRPVAMPYPFLFPLTPPE
jgi:hypothetical protein